ncbi:hypothetical protein BJ165DRAFT_1492655 [Panaeolus papilionaceus]|nr:hypothetical protein BJ165DRAFT_1492655 [Panaeolus papilionaceus]
MTPTGTPPTIHDLAPELIYQIMENFKPEGPIIYQKRVTHGSSVDHDLPAIQTIGAFRLTCSHLNAVTRPLLFHSVGFGNFQHERIRQFRELIDEDPTIAPAVRIFWLYEKRVGQGNQNLYQPTNMRKFWNSHDLPKILDRLICVESFGFVIPSIYSVDPAFSWDTLSEEMKLGISNLLSRPSITSLTFRCLTALPVALFTTSPSLRHLNVGLIDKVKSHVASSHMPLTTNVAPRAHRKVGWTIQSLNAEQGSQSLLSLHPTIEGCMSWNQCPPDCFSAITLRSKRFLKDLTIQLYYESLTMDVYAETLNPRLCDYDSLTALRVHTNQFINPSLVGAIASFINTQFPHPSPRIRYFEISFEDGHLDFAMNKYCPRPAQWDDLENALQSAFPRLQELIIELSSASPQQGMKLFQAYALWIFPTITRLESPKVVLRLRNSSMLEYLDSEEVVVAN